MDLSIYFQPSKRFGQSRPEWLPNSLGDNTRFHTVNGMPPLEDVQVAIIGVIDDPGHAKPRGCAAAPDAIREELYRLYLPAGDLKVVDLGDIHPGHTANDTQHAVADSIAELIKRNIIPVIIGGGQGHTFSQYLAYEKLERTANLVCVDGRFDLGEPGQMLSDTSYLSHIVLRQPNYLFNYSNLGFRLPLQDKKILAAHLATELAALLGQLS